MRTLLVSVLVAVLILVLIVPALLVRDWYGAREELGQQEVVPSDIHLTVFCVLDQSPMRLGLEEYVAGVVAAEMPPRFHPEALRAQAIAARTYAVRRMQALGGSGCRHFPGMDMCTDPSLGQAWKSQDQLRESWGFLGYLLNWRKVQAAVEETRGLILIHEGGPIDALYHSSAGERTEDSAMVWGEAISYLQSVESLHEDHSPYWEVETSFAIQELLARLDIQKADLPDKGGAMSVEVAERSPSGRAQLVNVGGLTWEGREFREALDLPSTLILDISVDDDLITFTTRGWGHGVGMSQYGADGMARAGASYQEILAHFYPGTELRTIFSEE